MGAPLIPPSLVPTKDQKDALAGVGGVPSSGNLFVTDSDPRLDINDYVWMGDWEIGTTYAVNDCVAHGGSSYICIAISTGNEPPSTSYWDLLAAGAATYPWRGAWDVATAYLINDCVSYNGSSYICIQSNTGALPTDAAYWDLLAGATDNYPWRGEWEVGTTYAPKDCVGHDGSSYICILASTGDEPPNLTYWDLLAAGVVSYPWLGEWDIATAYTPNDCVAHLGSSYICILASTGDEPPNATYWDVLASGAGSALTERIVAVFDGGGAELVATRKTYVSVPFACTITKVTVLGNQVGSLVIDIWKDTYANYPPTDADSITSATPPTIAAADRSVDSTLTSWTTSIATDDILCFVVDSCATITWASVILTVTRV